MKNMIKILLIGITIILTSCQSKLTTSHINKRDTKKESDVYRNFEITESENNGFVKYEYYSNGELKEKIINVHGRLEGPFENYYFEGSSENDMDYKYGIIYDYCERFYENGQLMEKGTFINDEKDGNWFAYNEHGKSIDHSIYKKGELLVKK